MPCINAMVEGDIISATPKTTLAEALDLFEKHGIRSLPVVDKDNKLVGLFNFHLVLATILPLPNNLGHGARGIEISLDHLAGQSGWVSGRLKNFLDHPLEEIMAKDVHSVHPDTPLREGVRLLAQHGSPLAVTDEKTNELVGLISSQSTLKVLLKMKADLKRNPSSAYGEETEE